LPFKKNPEKKWKRIGIPSNSTLFHIQLSIDSTENQNDIIFMDILFRIFADYRYKIEQKRASKSNFLYKKAFLKVLFI